MQQKQAKRRFHVGITMGRYEERVEEIKNAQSGVIDQSVRNQVYDDTMEYLLGFTKDTLRAVKIFKLFRKIGVDKIKRVISYSASANTILVV
jgi:Sec7-like guanine-nucleotide exchange factor